jgi:cation transport protein ChaC
VLHERIHPDLVVRDPEEALRCLRSIWPASQERWVFGYASLIWRPEFDAAERRPALLHGWHRALRMRSRVNRGTPDRPGLVFALLRGGACRGVVYRMRADHAEAELDALWAREQPTGVYDARVLNCRTPQGSVAALAFTLARDSPSCLPPQTDGQMLDILRHARGRFGTTLQYLEQTAKALRGENIRDREIERLMALAHRHGIANEPGGHAAAPIDRPRGSG